MYKSACFCWLNLNLLIPATSSAQKNTDKIASAAGMGACSTISSLAMAAMGQKSTGTNGPNDFCLVYLPYISGWWYTYPSEKYESQLGL